jgi:hypothetical protein
MHSYSSGTVLTFVCVCVCVCVVVAVQPRPILLLFALCTPELFCILKLSSSQVVLLLFTLINFTLQHYEHFKA